ncbi:hypothetical protein KFK09_022183 [Dendrobium nobile]|uniref:Uncharacterized protein n=1 Tax=Dendrobium nobile TaxID=94219 RepID=A0A8T3AH51_DENNO|nr:hypothetical protein KFK09_022183 [Dendrobium nobile]
MKQLNPPWKLHGRSPLVPLPIINNDTDNLLLPPISMAKTRSSKSLNGKQQPSYNHTISTTCSKG